MGKIELSYEAKKKMVEFFLKTSIPRLLEKQKRGELMDPNIGSKVRVLMPGRRIFDRILHEDFKGLYVKYNGKNIRVRPDLNEFGENFAKRYIVR